LKKTKKIILSVAVVLCDLSAVNSEEEEEEEAENVVS
jgi:hypothetical protein